MIQFNSECKGWVEYSPSEGHTDNTKIVSMDFSEMLLKSFDEVSPGWRELQFAKWDALDMWLSRTHAEVMSHMSVIRKQEKKSHYPSPVILLP